MDITKSNTVFIDEILHNKSAGVSKRKSVYLPKSLVPDDEPIPQVCNIMETNLNADRTVRLKNKTPIDKTVGNQGDIEKTTGSHTVAIKTKLLDGAKAKNVTAEMDATKKSVLAQTINAPDLVDDFASGISFHGGDIDITKSNTVFIDQISEKLQNKGVHVSDGLSKRKSLSCAKSLVSSDDTIRLVCKMEETNANVDVTENLLRKSSVDKTVCNEGNASDKADDLTSGICFQGEDMDITKSNTVFIDEISDLHNKCFSFTKSFESEKCYFSSKVFSSQ
ncbi:unnamed protein product [Ranitomeya imitator]|uniref:Breast cancer type 2 susceptibility protein n=1 Tax=Ranitomeya imitator TaxID=111125 RepID=A0ABN9KUT4_9NEOB|nr:unnamed protein product [Ranitomeya imitator]